MKVNVFQRGGEKNHAAIEVAAHRIAKALMTTRLSNLLTVRIELRASKLDKDTVGVCKNAALGSKPVRKFTVVLDRDMGLDKQLEVLAHELAHVGQFASGRLQIRRWKSDGRLHARWEGQELGPLDSLPYITRPWEVEARKAEELGR